MNTKCILKNLYLLRTEIKINLLLLKKNSSNITTIIQNKVISSIYSSLSSIDSNLFFLYSTLSVTLGMFLLTKSVALPRGVSTI